MDERTDGRFWDQMPIFSPEMWVPPIKNGYLTPKTPLCTRKYPFQYCQQRLGFETERYLSLIESDQVDKFMNLNEWPQ